MRNLLAGLGGSTGAVAAGGLAVALVAAGYWVQSTRLAEESAEPVALVAPQPQPEPQAAPEALAKPAEAAPEPAAPPAIAPFFDEVRREADGMTVIAGGGTPGAALAVLQNGQEIAEATVDRAGKFATIALIPPDGQGHVLSLLQRIGGETLLSEDEIILAPLAPVVAQADVPEVAPQPAPEETAAAVPEVEAAPPAVAQAEPEVVAEAETAEPAPQKEPVTETAPADTPAVVQDVVAAEVPVASEEGESTAPEPSAAPQEVETAQTETAPQPEEPPLQAPPAPEEVQTAEATPPTEPAPQEVQTAALVPDPAPQPVAVLRSTAEGVELLNPGAPEVMDNVAIDTISYSDRGDVQLAGRAQSQATAVRVYLNNKAVANLSVDAEGRWRGELPDVDEGIYTLRVDEVAADGDVTSRVETPFKREAPATLAAASEGQAGPLRAITVQKGATLWAIARERYGDGLLYVRVFEANRDAIRDPDLIYPGQIFELPE